MGNTGRRGKMGNIGRRGKMERMRASKSRKQLNDPLLSDFNNQNHFLDEEAQYADSSYQSHLWQRLRLPHFGDCAPGGRGSPDNFVAGDGPNGIYLAEQKEGAARGMQEVVVCAVHF